MLICLVLHAHLFGVAYCNLLGVSSVASFLQPCCLYISCIKQQATTYCCLHRLAPPTYLVVRNRTPVPTGSSGRRWGHVPFIASSPPTADSGSHPASPLTSPLCNTPSTRVPPQPLPPKTPLSTLSQKSIIFPLISPSAGLCPAPLVVDIMVLPYVRRSAEGKLTCVETVVV